MPCWTAMNNRHPFCRFPAFHYLSFIILIGLTLLPLAAQTQKGLLRTFINIQGVKITGRLKATSQGKVTIALPTGRDYTTHVASFSAADQAYIKKWGSFNPDSFIPSPVKSGIKLEVINALIGNNLFIDGNLWKNPTALVAERLGWPKESQTPHSSSYRGYPPKNYRFMQARPYSVTLYGNEGTVSSLSIIFANKGDFFGAIGSGEDHFIKGKPVPSGSTGLKMVMDRDAKAISDSLTKVLGQPTRQRFGDGKTVQSVMRWDWSGHSFLLAYVDKEYLTLAIQPVEFADQRGKSKRIPDSTIRKRSKENIEKRSNGDVVIKNIPMVDQGPKGYCVPATAERCMRYLGIPADMYLLALAGQTKGGAGTSPTLLLEAIAQDIKRKGRSFKIWKDELSIRKLAQYIDNGIPVMWSLYSTRDFNKIANSRTQARKNPDTWSAYKGIVKKESRSNKLAIEKNRSHIVIILGYNKETGEIAFSDSWGERYKERWITLAEAQQISQHYFYVVDL